MTFKPVDSNPDPAGRRSHAEVLFTPVSLSDSAVSSSLGSITPLGSAASLNVTVPLSNSTAPPLDPHRVTTVSIKEEAPVGPEPTTFHIEAQKTAAVVRVALRNCFGAGGANARYCGLEDSQQNVLQEVFAAVKQHCLDHYSMPDDAPDFTVNFSKRTVRFFDPATNHIKILDLQTMVNNDANLKRLVDQAETLIVTQINRGEIRRTQFAADNKGAADGGKPLIRPAYLDSLPKSTGPKPYEQAMDLCKDLLDNDVKRDQAVYRMAGAEIIVKGAKDKVTPLKTDVEKLLRIETKSRTPAESAELEKKWRILHKLNQLAEADTFALYLALALYPEGADANDPQKVAAAAKQLNVLMERRAEEIRLQKEKDGSKRTWIPAGLPVLNRFREEVKFEPSRFYPIDVGGLMFSGLEAPQARASYVDYCKLNGVYEKTDGIEDALIRKILRPKDPNPILDHLFDDITDATDRKDLQDALDQWIAEVAALLADQRPVAPEARIPAIRTQARVG